MAKKNLTGIIMIAIVLVMALILIKSPFGTFTILPEGNYNTNSNCTFITNADYGLNGENEGDYGSGSTWISIDKNGDGNLEGFIHQGSAGSTGDICNKSSRVLIGLTPIGLRVVLDISNEYIYICNPTGSSAQSFKNPAPSAILQCAVCSTLPTELDCSGKGNCMWVPPTEKCVPKVIQTPVCGNGICEGSETALTCALDCPPQSCEEVLTPTSCLNFGGCEWNSVTNKCSTIIIQCNTPADTNCDGIVSFSELTAYANLWVSGSVTFDNLIIAAQAWAVS